VVSGDAKSCAAAKSLIQKSLAAGCVNKLRKPWRSSTPMRHIQQAVNMNSQII
jgi:hypothetical protein